MLMRQPLLVNTCNLMMSKSGVVESKYITALFAMSDGSAEKFVSNKGDKVAQRLSSWADLLRQERLFRYQLTKAFSDIEDFLQRHTVMIAVLQWFQRNYHRIYGVKKSFFHCNYC